MASLFHNSRSIITRYACFRHTVATRTHASLPVKAFGAANGLWQIPHSTYSTNIPAQDIRQRLTSVDPIKPRPAGQLSFM